MIMSSVIIGGTETGPRAPQRSSLVQLSSLKVTVTVTRDSDRDGPLTVTEADSVKPESTVTDSEAAAAAAYHASSCSHGTMPVT